MNRLFLDHNATGPLLSDARDAMVATMEIGNPSSVHEEGRKAKSVIEGARKQISTLTGCDISGVIFTSGGTEAINMAFWGMARRDKDPVRQIFISSIEHSAVRDTARAIEAAGLVSVEVLPVTSDGVIDIAAAKATFTQADKPFLACIMLANNETGVIQPLEAIRADIFTNGGFLFVDGVQALGKIPVDFAGLQADLMSISAHKIGGPKGCGALLTKPGIPLAPLMTGGGQELRRRGGTENVIGIAGFGAAAAVADPVAFSSTVALRDALQTKLMALEIEGFRIWGEASSRLPNTLCFSAPGFKSDMQVMAMDLEGIAVSAGSACSSGKVAGSGIAVAMGASELEASSTLRVSLGRNTSEVDIERFIVAWAKAYERVVKRRAA